MPMILLVNASLCSSNSAFRSLMTSKATSRLLTCPASYSMAVCVPDSPLGWPAVSPPHAAPPLPASASTWAPKLQWTKTSPLKLQLHNKTETSIGRQPRVNAMSHEVKAAKPSTGHKARMTLPYCEQKEDKGRARRGARTGKEEGGKDAHRECGQRVGAWEPLPL